MSERAHGTRAKYVWDGCRCLACKVANTDYQTGREEARRQREPWQTHHAAETHTWCVRHYYTGEIALRGADRQTAVDERDRLNRAAARATDQQPLWAPPALLRRAQEYIWRLQRAGMGTNSIARVAGLSRNRLMEIADGRGHRSVRPKKVRIKSATARRILAVPYEPADGARVPAGPVRQMLDELQRAGLPKYRIAKALGSRARVPSLQIRGDAVLRSTLYRVLELHERTYAVNAELRCICRCAPPAEERPE